MHGSSSLRTITSTYFDLYPKPEGHDTVSIDLTPGVEDREDERWAENHHTEKERDNHQTDGVDDQHEEIVRWLTTEMACERERESARNYNGSYETK